MKRFVAILSFLLLGPGVAEALSIPRAPQAHVNDYAEMLSPSDRDILEQKLTSFEAATSNQIVLVTFPSLDGESLEDFSIRLADQWKIGQKGKENGVILLIFRDDRKMRIETGYGLEGVLTDATTNSIQRNAIAPAFKTGDYKSGIFAGLDAIMAATKGEYQGNPAPATQVNHDRFWLIVNIFLFLILFFGVPNMLFRRRGRTFRSGIFTGGGGSWGSGGGSWGGGSWGGGGGGGGGFSGGGGSFGGGGSSGSW